MDYLSKRIIKNYKIEFFDLVQDLRNDLGDNWEFHHYLVGSARRNMVLDSNEGFDLDFHLMLTKWPTELSDEEIKKEIMDSINNVKPDHLSNSKDSTHVITLKCVQEEKLVYSYDIAIIHKEIKSQILKNEKKDGRNGPYHFVDIPDSSAFFEKYRKIKGPQMWQDLRDNYRGKKETQHLVNKEYRIYSFALLQSATNEVLQKYGKI
jgi:hypothetical protein